MKRFWSTASVEREGDAFAVRLDARKLKLPGGAALSVPFAPLAEAIAAEWATAPENFTPDDVPLTRLVATAQEHVRPHRAAIIDQLAAYGRNDLLCYRATDGAARASEDEASSPWTGWAERRFGITLAIAAGLMPVDAKPSRAGRLRESPRRHERLCAGRPRRDRAGAGQPDPRPGHRSGRLAPAEACRLAALEELTQERQLGHRR